MLPGDQSVVVVFVLANTVLMKLKFELWGGVFESGQNGKMPRFLLIVDNNNNNNNNNDNNNNNYDYYYHHHHHHRIIIVVIVIIVIIIKKLLKFILKKTFCLMDTRQRLFHKICSKMQPSTC